MEMFTSLNGLGCDCQKQTIAQQKFAALNGIGAVSDYDQIKIGGKTYTVNQILDKTIVASTDTKIYSGARSTATVLGTIKAGQTIGKVFSYLRPDQADGKSWLMFEKSYNNYFFVPNEAASGTGLKDQGALTVSEEVKREQEELEKQNDPIGYYLKKYGLPVLLIGGGIYLAATYGKAFIQGKLSQPKPALAGVGSRKKSKKKSSAASQVLKLMDSEEDPNYAQAVKIVVSDNTKGMSANKKKQFKKKLEKELNKYI